MQINQHGAQNLFPGNTLTLSCIIMPDQRLSPNAINFTTSWTMSDGQRLSASDDNRITISESMDSRARALNSSVIFRELNMADAGIYTCKGTLSNLSPFITNSTMGTGTTSVLIRRKKYNVHIKLLYIAYRFYFMLYLMYWIAFRACSVFFDGDTIGFNWSLLGVGIFWQLTSTAVI